MTRDRADGEFISIAATEGVWSAQVQAQNKHSRDEGVSGREDKRMIQEGDHDKRHGRGTRALRHSGILDRVIAFLLERGIDPERPTYQDFCPFDQLHGRGATNTVT